MIIEDIKIREVLTTTAQKTIEVEIETRKGITYSSAPFSSKPNYLSSEETIKKFLEIKDQFVNRDFSNLGEVDDLLKRIGVYPHFNKIGRNLAFALSSALLKALSKWRDLETYEYLSEGKIKLPNPLGIITDKEKSQTDFQEYILYPVIQKSFKESIMKLITALNETKSAFENERNLTINKILKTLSGFTQLGLETGINFDATNLWNGRRYTYSTSENLTSQEQILFIQDIVQNYPVSYLEDPFHKDDSVLFSTLSHRIPTRLVVGNDLYDNNLEKLNLGIEQKATDGIVITPSELGTISDFVELSKEAKRKNIKVVIETPKSVTDDPLVCHLAIGMGSDYIKIGLTGHFVGFINKIIRIEEKLQ